MMDAASEKQVRAADPGRSTWVTANAGSGKTKVLIDRVARLLLNGVGPQHILCLTYTKAAAAEMQNRLFRRLGEWAMKPDEALSAALAELGGDADLPPTKLAEARRLFARAIETPGGLRIQTIHSFCATLLRRFPLEAGVTPGFTELDTRAARLLRDEIVDDIAEGPEAPALAALARVHTGGDFGKLIDQIAGQAALFARPRDSEAIQAALGLRPGDGVERIIGDVFAPGTAELLRAALPVLAASKTKTDLAAAETLRGMDLSRPGLAELDGLMKHMLNGESAAAGPYSAKIGSFPTKATQPAFGALLAPFEDLMRRVEAARDRRMALAAAERTLALDRFAAVFLPEYAARKAARGALDFDDLIARARQLLTDPSVAQWVLFRLDGGIDHILVDEAQDTSPGQWQVIERLAAEFMAGHGARDAERTIFVVGDKKQSIYSFQGADVAAFDRMKAEFAQRLGAIGQSLADRDLEHSFRSSPAILSLVDATFGEAQHAALGGPARHIAYRETMPGRVDLWPAIPPGGDTDPGDWQDPVDLIGDQHPSTIIGQKVAERIRTMIATGTSIPAKDGPRPCHAGDFLVLVRSRSPAFHSIIRACKALNLPIAGSDRLKLGAELAVKDLGALLSFLATPEDDLSLAAVLSSPLGGWSEGDLYDLAQGRAGFLWAALREIEAPVTAMLTDLRDQADYLRPYDLIERVLTRHDGRRRLVARLGPEAEDGIDEFLSQALTYEQNDVPSLTGFLTWLQTDEVEVKRQMESDARRIRVMTVHGAKGLEAPIVILPDTGDKGSRDDDSFCMLPGGQPVWKPAKPERPAAISAALALRGTREDAEALRLLYVAMTRAQSWLIVAAAGKTTQADCWHNLIRAGMERVGAVPFEDGLRHATGDWPAPGEATVEIRAEVALPGWTGRMAPEMPRPVPFLSPSNLGGAKALPGEAGQDEALAKARGAALHLLLEHLPVVARADWPAVAAAVTADIADGPGILTEATRILDDPALSHLFAPDTLAEVPLTAALAGGRLLGTVDRLIVRPDRITAVDFKSNRVVPATPAEVPEGILRQMAAYRTALAQIYPGRAVEVAILWTATRVLMRLDPDIVSAAERRTTIP